MAETKSLKAISFLLVYLGDTSSPLLSTDTRYGISPNDASIADSVSPELVEKNNGYNTNSPLYVKIIPLVSSTADFILFQYFSPFSSPHLLINSSLDEYT